MPDATVQFARRSIFSGLHETLACAEQAALTREEEFAALVKRQARFVYQIAHALLRNAADSEDAGAFSYCITLRLEKPFDDDGRLSPVLGLALQLFRPARVSL